MQDVVSIGTLQSGKYAIIRLHDRKILHKCMSISQALEISNHRYEVVNREQMVDMLKKRVADYG